MPEEPVPALKDLEVHRSDKLLREARGQASQPNVGKPGSPNSPLALEMVTSRHRSGQGTGNHTAIVLNNSLGSGLLFLAPFYRGGNRGLDRSGGGAELPPHPVNPLGAAWHPLISGTVPSSADAPATSLSCEATKGPVFRTDTSPDGVSHGPLCAHTAFHKCSRRRSQEVSPGEAGSPGDNEGRPW